MTTFVYCSGVSIDNNAKTVVFENGSEMIIDQGGTKSKYTVLQFHQVSPIGDPTHICFKINPKNYSHEPSKIAKVFLDNLIEIGESFVEIRPGKISAKRITTERVIHGITIPVSYQFTVFKENHEIKFIKTEEQVKEFFKQHVFNCLEWAEEE